MMSPQRAHARQSALRNPLPRWEAITVALSVRQPWAWLIVHGYKDVENRSWATSFRGPVLIHAEKRWTADERAQAEWVREAYGIPVPERPDLGEIVGGSEIVDCVTASDSSWFEGRYGFVLRHQTLLPFVPLPGEPQVLSRAAR
jgi:ASCH domain